MTPTTGDKGLGYSDGDHTPARRLQVSSAPCVPCPAPHQQANLAVRSSRQWEKRRSTPGVGQRDVSSCADTERVVYSCTVTYALLYHLFVLQL